MKKAFGLVGAVLALASTPVNAACWTQNEVAAAKVRDLDTMLMVSGLRCRFKSAALLQTYNAMVVRHRAALTQANMLLQSHFSPAAGVANELDRYVTRVANRYGARAEDLTCASLQSIAEAVLNEASTLPALVALADRAAIAPELPGGACDAPAHELAALR
jgi:hypothetical protein